MVTHLWLQHRWPVPLHLQLRHRSDVRLPRHCLSGQCHAHQVTSVCDLPAALLALLQCQALRGVRLPRSTCAAQARRNREGFLVTLSKVPLALKGAPHPLLCSRALPPSLVRASPAALKRPSHRFRCNSPAVDARGSLNAAPRSIT